MTTIRVLFLKNASEYCRRAAPPFMSLFISSSRKSASVVGTVSSEFARAGFLARSGEFVSKTR